ncbi:MAG: glycosyltransferase, partial [bacterium]
PRACKTWRVDNPIRKEFFSAPAVNRQLEPPILLNIGVISPRKRQIELLDMAARIHKRGISLELRFLGPCGSEPYASDFRRMVAEAEKEGYATYGGNLEITKLVSEMERASGLCHFPTEEAFGLVVAEALSKDLKFFGSRVGGIPGIVEGVEDAELIEPEDFQSLEELIVGWATSGSRSAEGGQALMRNRFHPKTIASVHLEIYREVLNRSNE